MSSETRSSTLTTDSNFSWRFISVGKRSSSSAMMESSETSQLFRPHLLQSNRQLLPLNFFLLTSITKQSLRDEFSCQWPLHGSSISHLGVKIRIIANFVMNSQNNLWLIIWSFYFSYEGHRFFVYEFELFLIWFWGITLFLLLKSYPTAKKISPNHIANKIDTLQVNGGIID